MIASESETNLSQSVDGVEMCIGPRRVAQKSAVSPDAARANVWCFEMRLSVVM